MLAAIVLGVLLLALSSRVEIPLGPVPLTLQSLAILLVGALYGPRIGTATVLAWLLLGVLGLPVLAGGAGGIDHFAGPTGGYLFAFPVAAFAIGWLVRQGWDEDAPWLLFAAALIGHAICLILGTAWLSTHIGPGPAIANGLLPFLGGAMIKSAMLTLIVLLVRRRRQT